MARYNAVLNSMWDDPAFQAWSADAKLIFLNLITSPRQNPIGLYAVTPKTLQFETGLPTARFDAAFQEIQQPINGYARVRYDTAQAIVWIVNTLKHQPTVTPQNSLFIRHIRAIVDQYALSSFMLEVLTLCKSKGLVRGLQGTTKDTSKDKDKDKDKGLVLKEGDCKGEQPHQTLINRFLDLHGTARQSLSSAQLTGAYKRHSRSALSLIGEAGGLEHALAALEWGAEYFDRKRLTWTLDTIAKHLPTFARCGVDDRLAQQHGLTPSQVSYAKRLADWLHASQSQHRGGADGAQASVSVVGRVA